MLNLAVFVSGKGSNFHSILRAISAGEINAEVKLLVSDKKYCGAFDIAEQNGIDKISVSEISKSGFITYKELFDLLHELQINLIVLAGFLQKIPVEIVSAYSYKIINIHPALLPAFGGKGMYGINVHKAVFESTAKVSGATVHFVDNDYDKGRIIAQQAVDISYAEDPEDIAAEVLQVEHKLLPFVIKKFSENKIVFENGRVKVLL